MSELKGGELVHADEVEARDRTDSNAVTDDIESFQYPEPDYISMG